MTTSFVFTRRELEALTKKQLGKLAEYYGVEISQYWLKEKIIDTIIEETNAISPERNVVDAVEEKISRGELPPMSVRVRRIYEANLEKENG